MGGLLGGQRVCWTPSHIIGGPAPPGPPSSYAYLDRKSRHEKKRLNYIMNKTLCVIIDGDLDIKLQQHFNGSTSDGSSTLSD